MNLISGWLGIDSKDVQTLTVAFAAAMGGLWFLYRFIVERANQTALLVEVAVQDAGKADNPLTLVKVTLKNIGRIVLQAKDRKGANGYTFIDNQDALRHSACIQVKKISWSEPLEPLVLDWHQSPLLSTVESLSEVNLLQGYLSKDGSKTEFWLEPGEIAQLLCPIGLPPGDYLIKVLFVGNKRDADYWSQIVYFNKQGKANADEVKVRTATLNEKTNDM